MTIHVDPLYPIACSTTLPEIGQRCLMFRVDRGWWTIGFRRPTPKGVGWVWVDHNEGRVLAQAQVTHWQFLPHKPAPSEAP